MKTRFKPKYNIRKGDMVIVMTGDSKPRKNDAGKIEYKPRLVKEVLVEEGKVIVEGANIITKHTKPSAQNTKGGIVKQEAPIQISNVMLWDGKQPSKVKREIKDDKKVRVSKKSGEVIK
jgi:large subunit ribosomal protein L24